MPKMKKLPIDVKVNSEEPKQFVNFPHFHPEPPVPTFDMRKKYNLKAILKLLQCSPPNISLDKLDEQISRLQDLLKSMKGKGVEGPAIERAVEQLECRRIYPQVSEFVRNYPITTNGRIDDLVKNYKLRFNTLNTIIKEIPLKAMEALNKFCNELEKHDIVFDANDFWLIAPVDWWETKRDPILLVRSPFGDYFYILCAWDKEVDIVKELYE